MKNVYCLLLGLFFVWGCDKEDDLSIDVLQVSLVKDSVSADNKTYAKITVKVDSNIIESKRAVKYEVSPIGTFNDEKMTYSTTVDVNGYSEAFIKSDKPGIAIVAITIGGYTRRQAIVFINKLLPSDIMDISVVNDSVAADNYTYVEIVAVTRDSDVLNSKKQVMFKAERGTFTNGKDEYSTNTNLSGEARAYLKCDKAELVKVVASIGLSYSQEVFIRFQIAWPSTLFVDLPQATIQNTPGTKIQVTAVLSRQTGQPTSGQYINFKAFRPDGTSIGIFTNSKPTNSDQKATADFWLQDTTYVGELFIVGSIVTSANDSIIGQNQLVILP